MPVLMKQIKPKRLQKGHFRLEMLNAMRKAGTVVKKDFEKTTATWNHKPKFVVVISLTGPGPVMLVDTDDKIYGYVTKGTEPHLIVPRRAKALSFTWGGKGSYKAKTKPGVIGSSTGGPTGKRVFRAYVEHPGTEARKFDEAIKKRREKWFKRQMETAMVMAAQKSGHGL